MTSSIACMVCTVDPSMASLMLPIAQATLIAAPILLRKEIARGVREIRARTSRDADAKRPGEVNEVDKPD